MSDHATLNVLTAGNHEPAFLFVHGFGCSAQDWACQIDALSPAFKCAALDLPGHGASAAPPAPTMAALAAAVNAVKAQIGARRTILVGHSLGCKVVREAYGQSRDGVAGIVLIEGALYEGEREVLVQRAAQAIDRCGGFHGYAKQHFEAMFVEGSDPALRERILARVRALDPDFGRSLYLEAVGWDPLHGKASLRDLDVPVLLIQSTHVDSQFKRMPLRMGTTTSFMDAVAQLCRRAELHVIEGCGHFPMIEASALVDRYLRDFATRWASAPAQPTGSRALGDPTKGAP